MPHPSQTSERNLHQHIHNQLEQPMAGRELSGMMGSPAMMSGSPARSASPGGPQRDICDHVHGTLGEARHPKAYNA
jgi:hypothetical protein